MEILRKPPYPLSAVYDVPDLGSYVVTLKDKDRDVVVHTVTVDSDDNFKITYEIPAVIAQYDDSYYLQITSEESEEIVVEDNLEIVRPYVDPATLGSTATEIAEYTQYEKIARAVIDSITGGFYYYSDYVDTVGQGTDYIPLWDRTYKILKVYENSSLVYDALDTENGPALTSWTYLLNKDKTAIIKEPVNLSDEFNRSEQQPPNIMVAPSDSYALFDTEDSGNIYTISPGVSFPKGYDYIFELEQGYKVVPNDIKEAVLMLINDIKCGKLDYYKRYVTSYSTDQFRIQFDKSILDGTGNILVDKILDKYTTNISKPGVL
jgi:hypothetical protein